MKIRKWRLARTYTGFSFLCMLLGPVSLQASQVTIRLISARDHIEANFLGDKAVYADEDRIYLASYQGNLFVLARDRAANFPVIQVVQDTTAPLTAVRGDSRNLYVASNDGNLRVYLKQYPLLLVDTIPLSGFGLSAVALKGNRLYVSRGQAHLAVDKKHVYLSELNGGDVGLEVKKRSFMPGLTYGETFEPGTTVVFDRINGKRISGITNPFSLQGSNLGANLYADGQILVQTIAGCCGTGIFIYDPKTLVLTQNIERWFTNTVVRVGRWLIAGNEAGQIDVFDIRKNPAPLVSSADLPQLTGHTDIGAIEIRGLWKDNVDGLIFAASSWGSEQSRTPDRPSFFVLKLVKERRTQ